ncbi:uncharacterized protein LACBIDRAFT_295984 [Laccaria bicolor S238N-H82]|uniref:Predicted protein n=1 Tax=Laccaria bicolor (strain S238N-H82 / ATCC MYA-4686) TaxID=486041 RepID=B0E175_LACBS|nr:uncharacterized protein LACBIDRAFT_295984 [Laccaria bicolor S238N-H82]EDQ99408.1 predicted protein [Laccaria bicolor S238N-H82]|eukprot:XP_001889959.1 predicted protein [Laccaria bicolor S238N-H82]
MPPHKMMSDVFPELSAVRDAISKDQPFCTGTYSLTDNSGRLFFLSSDGTTHCVDLANANDPKIHTLIAACERASFGLDNKDVSDETYRKAWEVDSSRISTRFDIVNTGILDHVYAKLLPGCPDKIRPELEKVNVYGPGSFSKAHKGTPRSEGSFSSLVVVFPIPHESGALQLRHKGNEWTFDSAAIISAMETPSIAYIAFHKDVEQEVNMVTSGFRVTLTYNLFGDDSMREPSHLSTKEDEMALRASLTALCENPDVLPDGGYLGFGLEFMYPIASGRPCFESIREVLKGNDGLIERVLYQLGLRPQLKIIYEVEVIREKAGRSFRTPIQVMLRDLEKFPNWAIKENLVVDLVSEKVGGRVVCNADDEDIDGNLDWHGFDSTKILWITPHTKLSCIKSAYVPAAFGNEPSLGYTYGNLCLVGTRPMSKEDKPIGPKGVSQRLVAKRR